MTRPSRRDIESTVDDLQDTNAETAREWIRGEVLRSLMNGEAEISVINEELQPPPDEIAVYVSGDGDEYSFPPEEILGRINTDADLPVRSEPNPFVVADVTPTDG